MFTDMNAELGRKGLVSRACCVISRHTHTHNVMPAPLIQDARCTTWDLRRRTGAMPVKGSFPLPTPEDVNIITTGFGQRPRPSRGHVTVTAVPEAEVSVGASRKL